MTRVVVERYCCDQLCMQGRDCPRRPSAAGLCDPDSADPIDMPKPRASVLEVLMWVASVALALGALTAPYWWPR